MATGEQLPSPISAVGGIAALRQSEEWKQTHKTWSIKFEEHVQLEALTGPALDKIWTNPSYRLYTNYKPLVPETLTPGGLVFLGINPSYTPLVEDADVGRKVIYYQRDAGRIHPYYQALAKFVGEVSRENEVLHWSSLDMLYVRATRQAEVVAYLDQPHGAAFIWEQLQLTRELLRLAEPRVLLVTNRFAAELLGRFRVAHTAQDGARTDEKVWLGYNFDFDEALGTYRCSELNGVPVFFTKPFSGKGSIHTGRDVVERLAWHVRYVLGKTVANQRSSFGLIT
jgi:hypothetical protein